MKEWYRTDGRSIILLVMTAAHALTLLETVQWLIGPTYILRKGKLTYFGKVMIERPSRYLPAVMRCCAGSARYRSSPGNMS